MADLSGLRVATGAEGCERALNLFGAKRIGIVTPYAPIGDRNVAAARKAFELVSAEPAHA